MVRDFVKFMVIVAIIYLGKHYHIPFMASLTVSGFLTTFTLLARDVFTFKEISWTLMRVFFGSAELGFSIMQQINPQLGPPLMVIFVIMTNTLLITTLVCALRESFSRVYSNAREEYLYVYSVYVLEASTSNSLTQFYPPFVCCLPKSLLFKLTSHIESSSPGLYQAVSTHISILEITQEQDPDTQNFTSSNCRFHLGLRTPTWKREAIWRRTVLLRPPRNHENPH